MVDISDHIAALGSELDLEADQRLKGFVYASLNADYGAPALAIEKREEEVDVFDRVL